MTEREFVECVRSLPRQLSESEVERIESGRDVERGLYVPHGGEVHHSAYESRH